MSGLVGYLAGESAEKTVAAQYLTGGYDLIEHRWRGQAGEIDLIFRKDDAIIFVEVKKSRDFATAAARLSKRQMGRIYASAGGYLARCPKGQDTESRFDVALVDQCGATEIIENAFGL